MNFEHSPRTCELMAKLQRFMEQYVLPNQAVYKEQEASAQWPVPQIIEDLKAKAT